MDVEPKLVSILTFVELEYVFESLCDRFLALLGDFS